jgi:hypothetical protein
VAITSSQVKKVSFEDFDPNNFGKEQEVWGLYDGSRFRTFSARPNALVAFSHCHHAKLYWMESTGHWREIGVKYATRTMRCTHCGGEVEWYNYGSPWEWKRDRGRIPPGPDHMELLYLCDTCSQANV